MVEKLQGPLTENAAMLYLVFMHWQLVDTDVSLVDVIMDEGRAAADELVKMGYARIEGDLG